jgi:hypothetical protein
MKKALDIIHNNSAFSILEVLIASTVLAIISMGVVSFTNNSMNTRDTVIREDRDDYKIVTAFSRIESDVMQIYTPLNFSPKRRPKVDPNDPNAAYQNNDPLNPPDPGSTGERYTYPSERFDGLTESGHPIPLYVDEGNSTLTFLSSSNKRHHQDSKQSQFVWIQYSLRPSANRQNGDYDLVRATITDDIYGEYKIRWERAKKFVLLAGVTKFSIEYWDVRIKRFVPTLSNIADGKYKIPAIKVTITWNSANTNPPDASQNGTSAQNDESRLITEKRIFLNTWPNFDPKKADDEETKEAQAIQ